MFFLKVVCFQKQIFKKFVNFFHELEVHDIGKLCTCLSVFRNILLLKKIDLKMKSQHASQNLEINHVTI